MDEGMINTRTYKILVENLKNKDNFGNLCIFVDGNITLK
jgi:hypothetical protein